MRTQMLTLGLAAVLIATGGCNDKAGDNRTNAQTPEARKAAGSKTIAAGLAGSQFLTVAKAAGLDQTLAGPSPYTVLVPDDSAFSKAPAGTFDTKPENRGQLTGVLSNLILQGTVLAADIDKQIDRGKGKAIFATMGGGTLTATKDGDKIVFTDSKGGKATVTKADDQYSNGVVHHIDSVLMPAKQAAAPPTKAG